MRVELRGVLESGGSLVVKQERCVWVVVVCTKWVWWGSWEVMHTFPNQPAHQPSFQRIHMDEKNDNPDMFMADADPNFFADNPAPPDDPVVHEMDIPPRDEMVYRPVYVPNGNRAGVVDPNPSEVPAPPGFMQFAIPDDQLPANSVRDPAYVQPGDNSSAVTGRVGEFCYLCYSSSRVQNSHHEQINRMWKQWLTTREPNAAARCISDYYNRYLKPSMIGEPDWTPDTIYRHFTQHTISETDITAMRTRQLRGIGDDLAMLMRTANQTGRLVNINDAKVRSYLSILQMEQQLLQKMNGTTG